MLLNNKTMSVPLQRNPYDSFSDEALVQALAGLRDERAFALLYDRWGARMYRFFLRMQRRDAAKAEDMTQDLFLKIIEKPHYFDTSRRFSTWIYSIAANQCKNEYRRKNILEPVAVYPETPHGDADELPEKLDRALHETNLQTAIDQLDEPYRQVFVLRWQEELPLRDIADIAGIPEGTVKSRLHTALKKVTACFHTL
jgi:RNA polymerase sigma-70 factor, ECF subfamily